MAEARQRGHYSDRGSFSIIFTKPVAIFARASRRSYIPISKEAQDGRGRLGRTGHHQDGENRAMLRPHCLCNIGQTGLVARPYSEGKVPRMPIHLSSIMRRLNGGWTPAGAHRTSLWDWCYLSPVARPDQLTTRRMLWTSAATTPRPYAS
jgi:hypothetical protein